MGTSLYAFSREGTCEAGREDVGLASLSNFTGSGAEGLSLVVWYLALRQLGRGHCGLECEGPIKEVLGGVELNGCSRRGPY